MARTPKGEMEWLRRKVPLAALAEARGVVLTERSPHEQHLAVIASPGAGRHHDMIWHNCGEG